MNYRASLRKIVTDESIAQTHFYGRFNTVKGVTSFDNHYIRIEDRDEAVATATLHEFGHYLDWANNMLSDRDEFTEIYNEESEIYKSAYNVNFYYDRKEMFGDGVYEYFRDKEALKTNCPKLYAYINNMITGNKGRSSNCALFPQTD